MFKKADLVRTAVAVGIIILVPITLLLTEQQPVMIPVVITSLLGLLTTIVGFLFKDE